MWKKTFEDNADLLSLYSNSCRTTWTWKTRRPKITLEMEYYNVTLECYVIRVFVHYCAVYVI